MGRDAHAELSLVEIFASAQGEGPEVGRSTVFVRTGGCDLRCGWCDSPGTWRATGSCRVEREPGKAVFDEIENPVPVEEIVRVARRLARRPGTWISLTGGEPLLQAEGLSALVPALGAAGLRVLLETHGLHVEALESLAPGIDLVSMDWKLASDVRPGPGFDRGRLEGGDFHPLHEAFLGVAWRAARSVCVKLVLTPNTRPEEFDAMCEAIARVDRGVPLVLQPVTPTGSVRARPSPERLLAWLERGESRLDDVRLVPQTHPIYGVL